MSNNFQLLNTSIAKIRAAISSGATLTPAQLANAMTNIDRISRCFGKSAVEFKTVAGISGGTVEYAPVTVEQLTTFIDHKAAMLEQHSYVLN